MRFGPVAGAWREALSVRVAERWGLRRLEQLGGVTSWVVVCARPGGDQAYLELTPDSAVVGQAAEALRRLPALADER